MIGWRIWKIGLKNMAEVKGKLLFLGMREVDRSENENGSEKTSLRMKKTTETILKIADEF